MLQLNRCELGEVIVSRGSGLSYFVSLLTITSVGGNISLGYLISCVPQWTPRKGIQCEFKNPNFFFLSISLGVRVSSLLSLLTRNDPSPKSVDSTVTSSNSNIAETDEDTSLKKEVGGVHVKPTGSEKVLMIILHSQNRIHS